MKIPHGIDLGWVAGLIEGEGCILSDRQARVLPKPPRYDLLIQVTMCDRDVLQHLQRVIGHPYGLSGPRKVAQPHHTPAWTFKIGGKNAYALLVAIYHLLHARARQSPPGQIHTGLV